MSQMLNYFFLKYLKKQFPRGLLSLSKVFFKSLSSGDAAFIHEKSGTEFPVFNRKIDLKKGISFFLIHKCLKISNRPLQIAPFEKMDFRLKYIFLLLSSLALEYT